MGTIGALGPFDDPQADATESDKTIAADTNPTREIALLFHMFAACKEDGACSLARA